MSEVFRFIAQRPVQRAAPQAINKKLIKAYREGDPTILHDDLRERREQGDRQGMLDLATSFVASDDFVKDLSLLHTPLAKFDEWLLFWRDEVKPNDLIERVKFDTNGKTPAQLVATSEYITDRFRVADSLLALTIAPSGMVEHRAKLLRAMYICGLLELFRTDDDKPKNAREIYQLLAGGIVVLPSDVFPLPAPALEPLRPDEAAGGGRHPDGGSDDASEKRDLKSVLGAIEELKMAFDSHVPEHPSGERPGASAEHPSSERTGASVLVPAAPGSDEEAPAPSGSHGEDGPESSSRSAPAWALPQSMVERLSRVTRKVAREVAGPRAFADVPETLARLEDEATALHTTLFANGSSPIMIPMGSRLVDLRSFVDGREAPDGFADESAPAVALARRPGRAELKVVRQKLKRYEKGEIAHIENALEGESRERLHRRKSLTETTVTVETERIEEMEQDVQSTERFELQREATKTAHEDSHLEGGVTVTASYGPTLQVTANAGFALNHSKDESSRESSNYGRDVTERSAARIQERVREERIIRTLNEVEETNKHGIDNSDGDGHVVGVYRWVDKVYEAQVFNYGQRLLLEFSVPEPAAFFRYALAKRPLEGVTLTPPDPPIVEVDPDTGDPLPPDKKHPLSPNDITPTSYKAWVQKYNVRGVKPPPKQYVTVGVAWERPYTQGPTPDPSTPAYLFYKAEQKIRISEGYKASRAKGSVYASAWKGDVYLTIGSKAVQGNGNPRPDAMPLAVDEVLFGEEGDLPVAFTIHNAWGYAISLEILCERTNAALDEWQLETYEAIMLAYFELRSQYDEQVAAAATRQGIGIAGRNPLQNRTIERNEIKKAVISMLTGKHFDDFGAIKEDLADPGKGYPEVDVPEAHKEGETIHFFEQAFEWPQMTYTFYPYFWGRKSTWVDVLQLDDADPIFASFLTAGAARVVVPVRPGFDDMVTHYLGTGEKWFGGQVPQVGDELYISIAQETREQQDASPGGVPEDQPWEVRLPTTLAILQDANLPS